jgi:hypothetical protein
MATRVSFGCRCDRGWVFVGWGGVDLSRYEEGDAVPDIMLKIQRPCRRCGGTGVYVSRARAGLADQVLTSGL